VSQPSANNRLPPADHLAAASGSLSAPGRLCFALATGWSAISLALLVWTLSRLTIDRSRSVEAPEINLQSLWPYWVAAASCWIGLTALWMALLGEERGAGPRASHLGLRSWVSPALIVLGVAIAARATVLIVHEPSLSDDVYRYVYDGRNLAHGFNPYLETPIERTTALASGGEERWTGERELLRLLAYPEISTPYLPLSQYVFGGLGVICERGGWTSPSSSARVFRCGFVVIEIGLMLVLLAALRTRGLSAWWLALYAWHPLPVSEFAGSGHQDVIGIVLLAGALLVMSRANLGQARGYVKSAAALAGATMIKPLALLAGPIMLRKSPPRSWMFSMLVGAIVCIALALPLRFWPGAAPYETWKATADWMAEKAAHFGGVYEPVLCILRHAMPDGAHRAPGFNLEQEWLARKICLVIFALAFIVILLRVKDAWRATAAAVLALTLCSTTAHPWYLLWAFALAPLAMNWTLWTYALTITLGYVVFVTGKGHALGVEWTVAPWMIALAYIPVLIALVADGCAHVRRAHAQPPATADLRHAAEVI
jgi:alpha-1,6-mannosyltransferase